MSFKKKLHKEVRAALRKWLRFPTLKKKPRSELRLRPSRALMRTLKLPILPLELLDMIMDYLRGDRATLEACSLISSHWTPAAQRRLFRSLKITISHLEPAANPFTLKAFESFFQNTPYIAPLITSLHICPNAHYKLSLAVDPHSALMCLLHELPKLQRLTLNCARLSLPSFYEAQHVDIGDSPPRLSLQRLSFCSVIDKACVAHEILEAISVEDTLEICFSRVPSLELAMSAPVFQLRNLSIKNPLDSFPCFGDTAEFPNLRTLTMDIAGITGKIFSMGEDDSSSEFELFPQSYDRHHRMDVFMEKHGATLETLRLNFRQLVVSRDIGPGDTDWSIYRLDAACPSLWMLELGFQLDLRSLFCLKPLMPDDFKATINLLVRIVNSAPKTLTHIVLAVHIFPINKSEEAIEPEDLDEDESDEDWARLAAALSSTSLPNLVSVKVLKQESKSPFIIAFTEALEDRYQQMISGKFTELKRRKMLYFE
ncbi:hypothetical protein BXZ70DRAFT_1079545 [Cristinia sonorae]|uniref:F-box domain-containing protein n=1 Tax=Cristinia sonorae TaxID=1940300 RepID=A0A8K0XMK7_9AGAR|nr:hypothetical protein BXZ70DRAFT_1079545 [Cristinia sonorae]